MNHLFGQVIRRMGDQMRQRHLLAGNEFLNDAFDWFVHDLAVVPIRVPAETTPLG